jgi:hypothetical protein
VSEGLFVLNAREAQWVHLGPGEPIGMYHWESNQEDFLVLSGEGLLLTESASSARRAMRAKRTLVSPRGNPVSYEDGWL